MKKPLRAQPLTKTPPVCLRAIDDPSYRTILLVGEGCITRRRCRTTSRTPLFVEVTAGLTIELGSVRVNKRRYPKLIISPATGSLEHISELATRILAVTGAAIAGADTTQVTQLAQIKAAGRILRNAIQGA